MLAGLDPARRVRRAASSACCSPTSERRSTPPSIFGTEQGRPPHPQRRPRASARSRARAPGHPGLARTSTCGSRRGPSKLPAEDYETHQDQGRRPPLQGQDARSRCDDPALHRPPAPRGVAAGRGDLRHRGRRRPTTTSSSAAGAKSALACYNPRRGVLERVRQAAGLRRLAAQRRADLRAARAARTRGPAGDALRARPAPARRCWRSPARSSSGATSARSTWRGRSCRSPTATSATCPATSSRRSIPYMQPLWDNLGDHQAPVRRREDREYKRSTRWSRPRSSTSCRSPTSAAAASRTCIFIVDEAQNLTPHEVKTIITRAGEGTKIVLTGDIFQIDTPYLDAQSQRPLVPDRPAQGQPALRPRQPGEGRALGAGEPGERAAVTRRGRGIGRASTERTAGPSLHCPPRRSPPRRSSTFLSTCCASPEPMGGSGR